MLNDGQSQQSPESVVDNESSNAGKKPTDLAAVDAALEPINWSHVFERNNEQKFNALKDLTDLSNATAGSYPLGISGLWHGGVHFDGGTAEIFRQTSVCCLADGEIVAYRVDERVPTTLYKVNGVEKEHPFSRNFVLVRHILVAPKIEGEQYRPLLTFYSLYMHLQNWVDYEKDPTIPRPDFWSDKKGYIVPVTAKDTNDKLPGQYGLKVYCQAGPGKLHDLLPRGAQVAISGEGEYRKLEGTPGPLYLQHPKAKGSLRGYVQMSGLKKIAGDEYLVEKNLSVYTEATSKSKLIGAPLPAGTQLKISGNGDFVKLEHVNQYVHFKSLQSQGQPQHFDKVVLPEEPPAIKAGELIGHMGKYQDFAADKPEDRLHLEVFSGDDVEAFIKKCRDREETLPGTSKTWLKFVKGTSVVTHHDRFSAKQPPTLNGPTSKSGANLLVPKSLLDSLPAEKKISISAKNGSGACNWYFLEEILNGEKNNRLSGWVREEVGVTPWVSQWAWDGYDIITDYTQPLGYFSSKWRTIGSIFTSEQLQRYAPVADAADKGPVKSRLYDIIDRDRDNKLDGEELQAAIRLPAHAQSISKLIVQCESEWYYKSQSWDALDEILGRTGSTPHVNWLAEKERIKQLSWWGEVADKVGLPADGKVYHFHPIGMAGAFMEVRGLIDVEKFLEVYESEHVLFRANTLPLNEGSKANLKKIILAINLYYESSKKKANVYEVSYMLATARHETFQFPTQEYFSEKPEVGSVSYFNYLDPVLASTPERRVIAKKNGNLLEGDGYKYRGRGCVHLTWKSNYQKFSNLLSVDFVSDPDAAGKFEHAVPIMIIGMTEGMFTGKRLADYINVRGVDYLAARRIINSLDEYVLIASYADRFESILKRTSRLSVGF